MRPTILRENSTIRPHGSEIYYEVVGEGPPLVFAHGLGGNYLSWWQQIPFFSEWFTCITFSHRGFWPSIGAPALYGSAAFADDLSALLDHLHIQKTLLVAQSMGGWTCLEFALRSPDRVKGLVMSSSSGALDFQSLGDAEGKMLEEWRRRSADAKKSLDGESILAATGKRMALEQPALYYMYHRLNSLTPSSYRENVRKRIHAERILPLEKILDLTVPVLFVTGEEDIVFPAVAASALASQMLNATYKQISHAGHSVYFERASEYNAVVSSFIERL